MIFKCFYEGRLILTTDVISLEEHIITLKYYILTVLDFELNEINIILENYGIMSSVDIEQLSFDVLGLIDNYTYKVIVIVNLNNDNTKSNSFHMINICSKVSFGKDIVKQIGFEYNKNRLICLSCALICKHNTLVVSQQTPIVNTFSCLCEYTNNETCFFKNISKESYDIFFNSIKHLQEILSNIPLFEKQKHLRELNEIKVKALQRSFDFEKNINYGIEKVKSYDSSNTKDALSKIFTSELTEDLIKKANLSHKLNLYNDTDYNHYFVRELLSWFKTEFFTWCDKPKCLHCKESKIDFLKNDTPNVEEIEGVASRTEVYSCSNCQRNIRFPRYNKISKLCETKTGRCGEWANIFGSILHYFKFSVRFIDNFEDHVWNEFWSESQKRWIHVDSCENAFDTPLIYEQGWKRNLIYVLGYSSSGVFDVTKRYVKNFILITERRKDNDIFKLSKLVSIDIIEQNDLNRLQLEYNFDNEDYKERESGSIDWKVSRGEKNNNNLK